MSETTIERICKIIGNRMTQEGTKKDIIKGVDLFRADQCSLRVPIKYEPSLIIIVQGKKRVYFGGRPVTYDPLNYLILSIPMHLECDTIPEEGKPLFGIRIAVDAALASEMAFSFPAPLQKQKIIPSVFASTLDESLLNALERLLESFSSPAEKQFLSPLYIQEILFRVLNGNGGTVLRMLAYRNQTSVRMTRLLEKIRSNYEDKYDIETLAAEMDMSPSAFYAAFKSLTDSPPLQYIKKTKLHKARELITQEGFSASSAAYRVGYESTSQFSREYKRLFGITPGRETSSVIKTG